MKGSQMEAHDEAVIRAAVTLAAKWKAFNEDTDNEDPDPYAEALEKAVDARQKALKATTSWVTPTPSITIGTQVRLTGVVTVVPEGGEYVQVVLDGAVYSGSLNFAAKSLEVIRQPFKRGEVVQPVGEADAELWQLVGDESGGKVLAVPLDAEEYQHIVALDVDDFERRPSRPKEE